MLNNLRDTLYKEEYKNMIVADFSDVAQSCKTYDEYIQKISKVDSNSINYFGIAIYGTKKQVNKLHVMSEVNRRYVYIFILVLYNYS